MGASDPCVENVEISREARNGNLLRILKYTVEHHFRGIGGSLLIDLKCASIVYSAGVYRNTSCVVPAVPIIYIDSLTIIYLCGGL